MYQSKDSKFVLEKTNDRLDLSRGSTNARSMIKSCDRVNFYKTSKGAGRSAAISMAGKYR